MSHLLLILTFVAADTPEERPRHPLAPSIPLLSKEEVKRVEDVIERLILYDIGKLKGPEGKKAVEDFNRLGREAIFQLIDGFNRAADMESSCPCVLIAKKISIILNTSEDAHLLNFARENLGAGVTAKRHMVVVKDLRIAAQLRRSAVIARLGEPPLRTSSRSPLVKKSVDELAELAQAKGSESKQAIDELGRRSDAKVLDILGAMDDPAAHAALQKWVAKQPAKVIGPLLGHPLVPVRVAAAQQAGKQRALAESLIQLLGDSEGAVVQAARKSLTQLSGGMDHGPFPSATPDERSQSIERWRAWWARAKR